MTFDQQLKEFVETERDNKPAGRRERIATAAMAGYIATGKYEDWQIPGLAFDMADRMIAELDKEKCG